MAYIFSIQFICYSLIMYIFHRYISLHLVLCFCCYINSSFSKTYSDCVISAIPFISTICEYPYVYAYEFVMFAIPKQDYLVICNNAIESQHVYIFVMVLLCSTFSTHFHFTPLQIFF